MADRRRAAPPSRDDAAVQQSAGPEPERPEIRAAGSGHDAPAGFEVVGPASVGRMSEDPKIRRIQILADWLDTKFTIPVINWPIGLDGIIGLIPGVGDTVTAGLSSYLIYEAYNSGASKRTLGRMGWNVGVDWVLGSIPLVGDIFDVAHKANAKNARLLLEELRRNQARMQARAAERQTGGPTTP